MYKLIFLNTKNIYYLCCHIFRCKKCLDCSSLLDDIKSLPSFQRDLVVVNSDEIGNKSFEELKLDNIKKVIKEQKELQILNINKAKDTLLGSADMVLDCVTWNILKTKDVRKTKLQNLHLQNKNKKVSNVTFIKNSSKVNLVKDNLLVEYNSLLAILHIITTKVKQLLNKDTISMLEIFCGELDWVRYFLSSRNDIKYTGIDTDKNVIDYNKNIFNTSFPLHQFYVYNALEKPILEKFDIVLVNGVLEWMDQEEVFNLLAHISDTESGYIIISENKTLNHNSGSLLGKKTKFQLKNLEDKPYLLEPPVCEHYKDTERPVYVWKLPIKQKIL